MGSNPAAPIDFVKEPVHDHKQHDHREESGRCLQMQSGNILAQLLHDSDGDKPSHKGGEESDRGTRHHRFAIVSPRAGHTGSDGSENENAFEPLAENENTDSE